MTVGVLIIFMDYVRKLWDPLKWLTEFVAKVRIFEAAAQRVFYVIDTPEPIREIPRHSAFLYSRERCALSISASATATGSQCSLTSQQRSGPARWSRLSARAVPGRPRYSRSCCASMTRLSAHSASTTSTFGRHGLPTYEAIWPWWARTALSSRPPFART
jgi:ABC-type multidrug transport system fused ATPase/permease subunit